MLGSLMVVGLTWVDANRGEMVRQKDVGASLSKPSRRHAEAVTVIRYTSKE